MRSNFDRGRCAVLTPMRYRLNGFVRICGHWQKKAENQEYESPHELLNVVMNVLTAQALPRGSYQGVDDPHRLIAAG